MKTFTTYNTTLSVINNPNAKGSACDFQLYQFSLNGNRVDYGLPNMPNYNLGPIIPPTVDAGENITTCKNQPAQLQAVSCINCVYDWQPAEYLSNANIANPFATIGATTTFTLTVTDTSIHASCNKTSTDTVTIFVVDDVPAIQSLYVLAAGDEFFSISLPLSSGEGQVTKDSFGGVRLEVINVNSQRVYQTENYQNDLALKNLSSGMYFYKINLPECYEVEGKFVVVR